MTALDCLRQRAQEQLHTRDGDEVGVTADGRAINAATEARRAKRNENGPPQHVYDKELSRRKAALMFYLIRSPIFDRCVTVQ